ncbi:MAG: hypothetical protein L0Z53_15225 [Acidobacteriales bacterium]|nr:hypothetical protein [Terriglobales bacterium]
MYRTVLVLTLSLATVCLAEEPADGDNLLISQASETGSETSLAPDIAAANPGSAAQLSLNNEVFSLSRMPQNLSGPAPVTSENSAALVQPLVLVSTPRVQHQPSRKEQRMWWALTVAQHSAATFDAWSTRESLSSGNGYERNPLMRPFANSAAIYPAIQIAPLGLDYISKRMMRSRHGFLRKTWWVPQTLATAGFAWSGLHNLRVAGK